MSETEWRSCEEVEQALALEGEIIGVTVHQNHVGFKTMRGER